MDLEPHFDTVRKGFAPSASADDKTAALGVLRAAITALEASTGQAVAPVAPVTASPSSTAARPDPLGAFLDALMARLPDWQRREIEQAVSDVPLIQLVAVPPF